ncbi:lipid IV(A) 3-deoxy-D-manno-octulosonic acid transferase [Endozoicomonas numazuensis]|uniref:3-deoxy-D-manno-octulosonic acid transferase n=1 Tax=Endozoicomonas numazuensis TaxID=1137799 RepID=A0A081NM13_9GAMM|nr:lipid IV(A) 3-deoxy-D-manno-octulosonic acid transferase [Endozoicomonas numazuensis]KEQ19486.1 3-deoxy-D-manno-octulosonic acid transferase [Endozoicomonas numazuensis]
MSRILYSILLYMAIPAVLIKLVLRARKSPAYRLRWGERFGFIQKLPQDKPVIWIHSVSVGEAIASAPMVKALMGHYPNHQFVITTMTPTGSERVRKIYGDSVYHVYCPYDLPDVQNRFLNRIHPQMALMMETELWPNTIAACKARNIPVVIVNARLSEKSSRGYAKLGSLTRKMMQNIHQVACQNENDGERFRQLGLPNEHLTITGSVKFDLSVDDEINKSAALLKSSWESGLGHKAQILIAASTHDGEDKPVLDAFKTILKKRPDTLLLLVPRHPERFNSVFELSKSQGLNTIRHSQATETSPDTQVIIGDTMGELMKLYATSDIAFVGGSLIKNGGHNMLEPAALGVPVLSGPSVYNFTDISQQLEDAGGMRTIQNSEQLAAAVTELLADDAARKKMGSQAQAFVEGNKGALQKLLKLVTETIDRLH